jgi:hypothetical protein
MSSSESSLLEKQTREKLPSSRESATPPRVQRSTASIHRELAIGYVLVPFGTFNFIVSQVQLNPTIEVGQAYVVRDADIRTRHVQRGKHNIEHELMFSSHKGYVFHDSCGFEGGSKDELKAVQDFVRQRSRERLLKDRLHAIWFVPLAIFDCRRFTEVCVSGTAFRWTVLGHR